jgi:hypothetical protein
MNKLLKAISVLVACMTVSPAAFAQAANGNGSCAQRVDIGYYKIERGRQDEWLGLYQKWHRKVMLYEIAHGVALSSKLYEAGDHAPGMPWDFAIINVYPVKAPPHSISRPDLIRKVFPDLKTYVAAERQRWALTVDHWDEVLLEMNTEEPLSVYYPVDGFCKSSSSH